MMRRLLICATLALALTGCSDEPATPPAPTASTSSAAATPSPTGPAAPVLPDAAKKNTAQGAEAFVRFYFQAITHAMKTGDRGALDKYRASDCGACKGISQRIAKIYEPGGRNVGGGWTVRELKEIAASKPELRWFVAIVDQPAQKLVSPTGKVVSRDDKQSFAFNVWASFKGGQWVMRGIGEVQRAS